MAKILIVDDDEGILAIMRQFLIAQKFEVEVAYNSIQARSFLENSAYDLILCDFKLPGESGIDLLRYIASRFPGLPFILMTGYSSSDLKAKAMRMGCSAYLEKPFQLRELLSILKTALRSSINQDESGFGIGPAFNDFIIGPT